mgnify:CR=1 FL=1
MNEIVMEGRNLARFYDTGRKLFSPPASVKALNGVSFQLERGKTLAIVGESGCGKSTLARLATMIEEPTGGELLIGGKSALVGDAALRSRVQIVFQNPYGSLNPRQKIGSILEEPLKINTKFTAAERRAEVEDMMTRVGLRPEHYNRYPHMFSGGQRQRIAIARSLMLDPKVIVADEAVSALDVSIKAQVCNLLLDLQQSFNLAYLFISHDMAVVERVSHRVAVMYLGEIVEIGPRQAVFENPQHAYTKKLMAAVPVPDPSRRRVKRNLSTEEIKSPIRSLGFQPPVRQYRDVGAGHLVQL